MTKNLQFIAMAAASLVVIQTSNAAVVTFTDLNTDLTATNTVSGSGSGTTSSSGVAGTGAGVGTFIYSVTYSDFDFDGDSLNDSFSFDVTVTGVQGTTFSNTGLGTSSAGPLSTTAGTVIIDAGGSAETVWSVQEGAGTRFESGETLFWSVDNIQTTNTDAAFTLNANFDGFTGGRLADRSNNGSPSGVYGLGANLNGYAEGAGVDGVLAGGAQPILYITSSATGSDANIGVSNVDFGFDVTAVLVPEPSSTTLLGLGGLALILRRRR